MPQQHFQLDAASFRFAYYLWRSQIVRIIHKLKGSLMGSRPETETEKGSRVAGGLQEGCKRLAGGLQLCASACALSLLSELHHNLSICSEGWALHFAPPRHYAPEVALLALRR